MPYYKNHKKELESIYPFCWIFIGIAIVAKLLSMVFGW